jgi:hypothetical protein
MERRTRRPVTNEENPKDRIGRGDRPVKDEKSKGKMPKHPKKPVMSGKRKIAVPGGNKK